MRVPDTSCAVLSMGRPAVGRSRPGCLRGAGDVLDDNVSGTAEGEQSSTENRPLWSDGGIVAQRDVQVLYRTTLPPDSHLFFFSHLPPRSSFGEYTYYQLLKFGATAGSALQFSWRSYGAFWGVGL